MAHKVRWIVDCDGVEREVRYTLRPLSSLIGRKAIISDAPSADGDVHPTILYADRSAPQHSADLIIRPDRAFWKAVRDRTDVTPHRRHTWCDTAVPTWATSESTESDNDRPGVCPVDPIAAAFFLVSRIEEWRSTRHDSHGRFPAESAWMVNEELIERPLVHEYAGAITRAIGIDNPFEPVKTAWPDGKQFAIAFTHDIDRLRMHGPL